MRRLELALTEKAKPVGGADLERLLGRLLLDI
jgi:hypothetical protein